jgi:2,4-dienoyl-CoA reductase-like NADH-dependent reductase (Old Yellow Enzyme family)
MTMLRTIETFLRQTGIPPTRFGRDAVRDPRIVFDMRNGREPSERMCRRLNHYIASHSGEPSERMRMRAPGTGARA